VIAVTTDDRLAIAEGLAAAASLWRGRARHDGTERHAVRLLATERYEAWLIGWPPGHTTRAHDHGGSAAAIVVVEGALEERTLAADGGARRRILAAGSAGVALAADVVHDVGAAGLDPATSIHVYSPPLSTMTFYDEDGVPDGVLVVEDEAPVLRGAAASLALHPSAVSPR
jgi:predicted metal-dependent enzyme (double-stranded beta helix superfamily)